MLMQTGPKMILHYGDLADSSNLIKIISDVQPTEIYNLAAQSHVKVSFDMPGMVMIIIKKKNIQHKWMDWELYDCWMQLEFVDYPTL